MPDLQLLTHVRYFAAKAGVAAVMLFPVASSAQPRVRLDPPVTVSEPRFSAVTGAVLLPDGRVIVSDPIEQAVVLVERRGTSRVLGRIGSGPGEYRQPQKLLALRNKGALLIDPELRRLTLIDVTARFAPAVPFPSGLAAFALAGSQSVSDSGIMHFSAPLIGARPREEPVFRWRWPYGTLLPVDTILGEKLVQAGAGSARIVPLSHADAVATLTDGTRVTMRASERVVEWVPPKGRPVRRPFPGGA